MRREPLTFMVKPEVKRALAARAEEEGRTVSNFVGRAIEQHLERERDGQEAHPGERRCGIACD